jgi:anti-sigma regulatory factor (Ser/Thr protein kinase)
MTPFPLFADLLPLSVAAIPVALILRQVHTLLRPRVRTSSPGRAWAACPAGRGPMTSRSSSGDASLLYRWTDHTPDALFQARAALRRATEDYGLTDNAASDALMAGAELMANAVEHARGPYELHARRRAAVLVCEVVDHDPNIPELPEFGSSPRPSGTSWDIGPDCSSLDEVDERGRGLQMVHQLSRGVWGMRACGHAKVVWCSIALE